MHIEENFTDRAVIKLTCVEVDFVAPDSGFLDIALATIRQTFAQDDVGLVIGVVRMPSAVIPVVILTNSELDIRRAPAL